MVKYTLLEIQEILTETQAILEAEIEGDNMAMIIDHANLLASRLAISGKLLSDAKFRRSERYGPAVMEMLQKATSEEMYADAQKKYLMSLTKDYDYLIDWAERTNATLTHLLDYMRSLLSKEKELMKMKSLPDPTH